MYIKKYMLYKVYKYECEREKIIINYLMYQQTIRLCSKINFEFFQVRMPLSFLKLIFKIFVIDIFTNLELVICFGSHSRNIIL